MSVPQTEVPVDQTVAVTAAAKGTATPTSGFKSSELAVLVATVGGLLSGHVPPNYDVLLVALSGVYISCRTLLKVVHTMGYAKKIPDLPAIPDSLEQALKK